MIPRLRPANADDLEAINAIYNHYVISSTATYQEEPTSHEARLNWFTGRTDRHPIIVATDDAEKILGWASLNPFHPRSAYRFTAENSVYVHPDFLRQGIGKVLLNDLLTHAIALNFHNVIALISADQTPSIHLHRAAGFKDAGTLHKVGWKFERWLDVLYMQWTAPAAPLPAKTEEPRYP